MNSSRLVSIPLFKFSLVKKSRKKLFRDFSYKKQIYSNELKRLRAVLLKFEDSYDLFEKEILFMLWAYDLEFWTLDFAARDYGYSKKKLGERIIYPLVKEGYVYKYFDKLTPSNKFEDHLFRDETKFNYRVRYALTKKARLMVRAFYRKLGFDVTQLQQTLPLDK